MKRSKKSGLVILALTAALTGVVLAGCGGSSTSSSENSETSSSVAQGITLDKTACTLGVGEELTLKATVTGGAKTVQWSSSDPATVEVNGGKLTALKQGTAVITATAGGASATCSVTITRATAVGTLTTDYSSLNLLVGGKAEINASVSFHSVAVEGLSFEWSSDNTAVAALTTDKGKATVTGVAAGDAQITVSCIHFGETLTETVSVSVRNDVSLSVDNLTKGEDGYSLTLVKSEPQGYVGEEKSSFIPSFSVTVDGAEKENAAVSVVIPESASSVARYDEWTKSIVAVGVGEAQVSFVYTTGGKDYQVDAKIKVILPEVSEDICYDIEKKNATYTLSSPSFPADPTAVTIDGAPLAFEKKTNGIELSGYGDISFGEHALKVESADVSYSAKAFFVTAVIDTKEQLDSLGEMSAKGNGVWDGYFVLGADIDYNGTFKTFCGLNYCPGWGGATGFVGTFDGRGHIIKGLTIAADGENRAWFGGMFGVLGTEGVVKNVGFAGATNAAGDASGIVADISYGTVEDVFVEFANQGGTRCAGIARYAFGTVKRCMVFLTDAKEANAGDFAGSNLALVSYSAAGAKISDCYCVGSLALYNAGGDTPTAGAESATLKRFETYAAMKAYAFTTEGWSDAWTVKDGIPLFAAYADYIKENAAAAIGNDNTAKVSSSLNIQGPDCFIYTLKEAKDGISIEGKTISINGCFDEQFTVVATWIFDGSVTAEKTFTVDSKSTEKLSAVFDVDSKKSESVITLAELADKTASAVRIGDVSLTFTQNGTALTLGGYADLAYGEYPITIETNVANYQAKALVAVFISTTEEWNAEVAATASAPDQWNKYYVLAADLDYTGKSYVSPKGAQYGAVFGFKGTFDGRNHKIIGVVIRGESKSFFGTVALTAVIKNVNFYDCALSYTEADGTTFVSTNKSAIVADLFFGTLENVSLKYANDGHWWCAGIAYLLYDTATVKNCMAEVTGHTGDKLNALFTSTISGATVSDCYVITALAMPITVVGGDPATGTAFVETDSVKTFASAEAMKAAGYAYAGWDTSVWDLKAGYPVMRAPIK